MGGQKIDDHASWVGKGSQGTVFPAGAKVKTYQSSEGAAEVMRYEDSSEMIKGAQDKAKSQAKSLPMKEHYRQ